MSPKPVPASHLLLALAVVAVWGTNFTVIRLALDHMPPFLFAFLRFAFALLPAAVFVPRPPVPWRNLAAYGVLIGAGQFGILYFAVGGYIAPGLASLVVQVQVFFTIGLSMWRTGERLGAAPVAALVLGAAGIAVIAAHTDASTTPLGLGLVIGAGFCWACGNIVAREGRAPSMLAYVVWSSLFALPPLLVASLLLDGWPAVRAGLADSPPSAWAAVLWQSVGNTLFGYAAWGWLLARHPAASITPSALLVPVFGMGAASLWLGEPMPPWKIGAAALVIGGLAVGTLVPRWQGRRAARG